MKKLTEKTAKDYLGKELNVGDAVVFNEIKYKRLRTGVVKSVSEKMVTLTVDYSSGGIKVNTVRQFHNQVVKIIEVTK